MSDNGHRLGLVCRFCRAGKLRAVVDTRKQEAHIRRRKRCDNCSQLATTYEVVEPSSELMPFIITYKSQNDGCSPAPSHIIDGTSYTSSLAVIDDLNTLQRQGYIEFIYKKGESRRIMVVGGRWTYLPVENGGQP